MCDVTRLLQWYLSTIRCVFSGICRQGHMIYSTYSEYSRYREYVAQGLPSTGRPLPSTGGATLRRRQRRQRAVRRLRATVSCCGLNVNAATFTPTTNTCESAVDEPSARTAAAGGTTHSTEANPSSRRPPPGLSEPLVKSALEPLEEMRRRGSTPNVNAADFDDDLTELIAFMQHAEKGARRHFDGARQACRVVGHER